MTFISYAQNLEDVMLRRALKHIEKGFYVDVGANDPVIDSVTKAFYEMGWSGINIEPDQAFFQKLVADRPRDINMHCAAGEKPGELTIHIIPETGLSTAVGEIAERHAQSGWKAQKRTVPAFPLKTLLEPYASRDIHFLKIDVEGMEAEVIKGMDFQKIRPWILVIEAIIPCTQTDCSRTWENGVLRAGYDFVHFDGVNRFYVLREHDSLMQPFHYPPGIFDNYTRFATIASEAGIRREMESRFATERKTLLHDIDRLNDSLGTARQRIGKLEATLEQRDNASEQMRKIHSEQAHLIELLGQSLGHLSRENTRLDSITAMAEDRVRASVQTERQEIERLRRLLYAAPAGTHAYRAMRVFLGDKHYRQYRPEKNKTYKKYNKLDVPWHTHLYRALLALKREGVESSREHLARMQHSWKGDPRYSPIDPKNNTPRAAAAVNRHTPPADAPTVLLLSTYPFQAPRHGGQHRLFNIAKSFRDDGWHVHSVAIYENQYPSEQLGPNDIYFPPASKHRLFDGKQVPFIADLQSGAYAVENKDVYSKIARELPAKVDAIHVEQPWLWPLAKKLKKEAKCASAVLINGTANIEWMLKCDIFKAFSYNNNELINKIKELETSACEDADLTLAVTRQDLDYFKPNIKKSTLLVSNGASWRAPSREKLDEWKEKLPKGRWILYIASAHPPNFTDFITCIGDSLAPIPPDGKLVVAGGVCCHIYQKYAATRWHSLNLSRLQLLHELPQEDLDAIKYLAPAYLLPISHGGGSNLKTAEALISGAFVIGSRHAFRGYEEFMHSPGVLPCETVRDFQDSMRLAMSQESSPELSPEEKKRRMALSWENKLSTLPRTVRELLKQSDCQ